MYSARVAEGAVQSSRSPTLNRHPQLRLLSSLIYVVHMRIECWLHAMTLINRHTYTALHGVPADLPPGACNPQLIVLLPPIYEPA